MRSRVRDVPAGAGADFGVAHGLVGIGEAVEGRPQSLPDANAAREVGIHHVRPTVWSPRRFGDDHAPAAVARTFARGGRNLQRTYDDEAERHTLDAWQRSVAADGQAATTNWLSNRRGSR
jgi:hypothetical protein